MPEVSPLIRIFVSSTFADFAFEREVLQRAVFPRLRTLCAAQGCRFQPIDLRWGVSEEAGNERRTLAICLDEIARCQRLSPDLNFLILLGDRYGSCFLPESIPSEQVIRILPHLASTERAAFTQAYKEDLNALRPEFVLLPSDGSAATKQREESLRHVLARAAQSVGFSDQELLPFVASATHLEIQRGLLDASCDPAATICAIRSLDTPPAEQNAQMEALKASVEQRLGNEHIWRYSAQSDLIGSQAVAAARKRDLASSAQTDPQLQDAYAHYDALAEQFYSLLEPRIQQSLARRQSAAQARDPGAEANHQFAKSRASVVVGREDALKTVASYLAEKMPLALVVTGESGVGKSTLVARAVENARVAHPNAVILTRYIGVTPGTSSLADLLSGLRREIATCYGLPEPEPVGEMSQLVAAFARQLGTLETTAERPLFLIIDALDQLGSERQRMDWLPSQLAPNVRLVASILSDREELADLRARLPLEQLLQLAPLTRAQGVEILRAWLADEGRTLTTEQEALVLDGFAPKPTGSGTPLYLRLAAEQARAWRSFDPPHALPPTVPALIQSYFAELELPARHGSELVAYALGDLAAAKHGLAEDELLDLLSRSEAVRNGLHQLSPNAPPIETQLPLPMALWARLIADLERYLTEREADGAQLVTFYHRQLLEEAARRYLDGTEQMARHADLAAYFGEQPYQLSADTSAIWNRRKLAELVFQQAEAGSTAREALETTLTDGRFLEGKLTVEGVTAALDDLTLAPGDADIAKIATVVRSGAVVLTHAPSELLNQIIGRVGQVTRLHGLPEQTIPLLRLRSQSLKAPDPALLHILQGHDGVVYACALSADGRLALSASADLTLRLWDTTSGGMLRTLEGHTDTVKSCALSADGRLALSASEDRTLRLWDTTTGQTLQQLDVARGRLSAWEKSGFSSLDCALSPDGRLALSFTSWESVLALWDTSSGELLRTSRGDPYSVRGCALSADGQLALSAIRWNRKLALWNTISFKTLMTLEGHTDTVKSCALSADGRLALSASEDRTLRLWDTTTGKLLRVFTGHTKGVYGCSLSADGRLALSASWDQTLRLWDTATGELLRTYADHQSAIYSCALSADGRLALSASGDATLRLWDTASGRSRPVAVGNRSEVHHDRVTGCALSADGRLALSASEDATLRLWDTASSTTLRTLEGHSKEVRGCALSADGRLALSASDDETLRLWDTTTGQTLRTSNRNILVACALSAERQLAISTSGKDLVFYDIATMSWPHVHFAHAGIVRSCSLSADGRLALSAADDKTLLLWDTATRKTLRIFEGHTRGVYGCSLSADGRLALSASGDRTLRLWDTVAEKLLGIFVGHTRGVYDCSLSADGRLALSASGDRTLRLWDTYRGQEIARWTHDAAINCCALSAEGDLAVTGDMAGGFHFLEVSGVVRREYGVAVRPTMSWLEKRQPYRSSIFRRLFGRR